MLLERFSDMMKVCRMRELSGSLPSKAPQLLGGPRGSSPLASPASDSEIEAAGRELGIEFPPSYQAFLRYIGAARIQSLELFGLPRNGLWGDVVLMNQLISIPLPPSCVMIGRDDKGSVFCLDTSSWNAERECPILVFNQGKTGVRIAPTFLDFLVRLILG